MTQQPLGHSEQVHITEVQVELGPLSGVEPLLLTSAFEALKAGTGSANAKLKIEEVPLTASCSECKTNQVIVDFVFRCPHCQGNLDITRGDGFYLVGVSYSEGPLIDSSTLPSPQPNPIETGNNS